MEINTYKDTFRTTEKRKGNDFYNPRKQMEVHMKAEAMHEDPPRYIKQIKVLDPTIISHHEADKHNLMAFKSDEINPYKYVPHIDYLPKWSRGCWEVEETGYSNINIHKSFKPN